MMKLDDLIKDIERVFTNLSEEPDDGMHGKITVNIDGEEYTVDLDNPDMDVPIGITIGLTHTFDILNDDDVS